MARAETEYAAKMAATNEVESFMVLRDWVIVVIGRSCIRCFVFLRVSIFKVSIKEHDKWERRILYNSYDLIISLSSWVFLIV